MAGDDSYIESMRIRVISPDGFWYFVEEYDDGVVRVGVQDSNAVDPYSKPPR